MPIYEYGCTNCEHTFDTLQKISDPLLTDCPQCGQAALRRLVSAPRFRLKGQGWYETDFKKDNQRNLHGDKEPKSAEKSDDGKDKPKPDKPKPDKPKADKPASTANKKESEA